MSTFTTMSTTKSTSIRPVAKSASAQPVTRSRHRTPVIVFIVAELLTVVIAIICVHNAYHQGRQDGSTAQLQAITAELQTLASAVRNKSDYASRLAQLTTNLSTALNLDGIARHLENLDQVADDLAQDVDLSDDFKSQAQDILATYRAACVTFQDTLAVNQQDDQAYSALQEAAIAAGQQLTNLFNQYIRTAADHLGSE